MVRRAILVTMLMASACDSPKPATPVAPSKVEEPTAAKPKPTAPPELTPTNYRIERVPGDASDESFELMDGDKPAAISDTLQNALAGASSATLLHQGNVLVYQHGDILWSTVLKDSTQTKLVTFFPGADVSELYSAPDNKRIVIISRNPTQEDYGVKLFALDVAVDGTLSKKRRATLDPAPLIRCLSRCIPAEVIFDSPDLVRYLVSGGPDDPAADGKPPVYDVVPLQ